jgi:hypothetical protein
MWRLLRIDGASPESLGDALVDLGLCFPTLAKLGWGTHFRTDCCFDPHKVREEVTNERNKEALCVG